MNSKKPCCNVLCLLAAMMLLLSGCSVTLRSADVPLVQAGSPLQDLQPKTFLFNPFVDTRGSDPILIHSIGGKKLVTDRPAAEVAQETIMRELRRVGHTCITDPSSKPYDYVVDGTLYRFGVTQNMGMWEIDIKALAGVKLTFKRSGNEKAYYANTYEGQSEFSHHTVPPSKWAEVMNDALAKMAREMSVDANLKRFLEQ